MLCGSGNLLGAFAQDTTIHSGFSVVTLISGNVAGLITTETLVNQTGSGGGVAIVPPSPLLTTASMLVPIGPLAENTTAIAIANPSAGAGSINFILTDNVGTIVLNTIVPLGPFGHFSRYLNEFFATPPGPFSTPLLLTVSSEIPVAILALNFRSGDFTAIPLTSLFAPTAVPILPSTLPSTGVQPGFGLGLPPTPSPPLIVSPPATVNSSSTTTTAFIGGAGAMVFPEVAFGGGWSTQIAIGNTSSATQTIRIDIFGDTGTNTASLTDVVIPPRGVFLFSTDSIGGVL